MNSHFYKLKDYYGDRMRLMYTHIDGIIETKHLYKFMKKFDI